MRFKRLLLARMFFFFLYVDDDWSRLFGRQLVGYEFATRSITVFFAVSGTFDPPNPVAAARPSVGPRTSQDGLRIRFTYELPPRRVEDARFDCPSTPFSCARFNLILKIQQQKLAENRARVHRKYFRFGQPK